MKFLIPTRVQFVVEMQAADGKKRKVQASDSKGYFAYHPIDPIAQSRAFQTMAGPSWFRQA